MKHTVCCILGFALDHLGYWVFGELANWLGGAFLCISLGADRWVEARQGVELVFRVFMFCYVVGCLSICYHSI